VASAKNLKNVGGMVFPIPYESERMGWEYHIENMLIIGVGLFDILHDFQVAKTIRQINLEGNNRRSRKTRLKV
jgi:hypothetical protein